jgi:hypothetical protein
MSGNTSCGQEIHATLLQLLLRQSEGRTLIKASTGISIPVVTRPFPKRAVAAGQPTLAHASLDPLARTKLGFAIVRPPLVSRVVQHFPDGETIPLTQ